MTKANECTCPSGDGSLRHPCPAHPAPAEQAGGDERAAFRPAQVISYRPGVGEVTIYVAGRVPGYMNIGDTVYVSDRAPVEQPSAALAQPSPAQAEQAEAERPNQPERYTADVFHPNRPYYMAQTTVVRASDFDAFAAQYERIVGALRAEIAEWQEAAGRGRSDVVTYIAERAKLLEERDAALARVAELEAKLGKLEKQEPVAVVKGDGSLGAGFPSGTKLYAAPVAQAQQLNDLDKQCRDDVARALGLRPNQERGFAWSYLLASIKSCVKASEDSAQAQHSVPGDIMRDAQRYRWLRDQQFYFSFSTENSDAGISSCTAGMSSRFKNLSWVDAAIDSAIAAAPGKEGV